MRSRLTYVRSRGAVLPPCTAGAGGQQAGASCRLHHRGRMERSGWGGPAEEASRMQPIGLDRLPQQPLLPQ